jgi:acetylglutamate kinase
MTTTGTTPAGMMVVKLGGRTQQDPALPAALAAAWAARGGALVVVHGGGDEASALMRAMGREPQFVGGRRITAAEDIDILRMALSGSANKRLVSALVAAGARALGISGEDGAILRADTPADLAPLGLVGRIAAVDAAALRGLVDAGWLPVLSPVSADRLQPGRALNVNGDDAAAAVAAALGAEELLLVSDVQAVLAPDSTGANLPLGRIDGARARALVDSGIAAGGMAAKLGAALDALAAGVARVRVSDVAAITDAARGTVITNDTVAAGTHRVTASTSTPTSTPRVSGDHSIGRMKYDAWAASRS